MRVGVESGAVGAILYPLPVTLRCQDDFLVF